MPWSTRFLDELKKTRLHPRFRLETAPALSWMPGAQLHVQSHTRWDGVPGVISLQGSSIRAGQLNVGDWSHTVGELSIGLIASYDARKQIPRGTLIRLLVGFDGFDAHEYEPVFLGQLQDIRWVGQQWQLSARSILGALQSRLASTNPALFSDLRQDELAVGYTAGSSTEIELVDRSGLEELSEIGFYLVLVTPDSGEPFFVLASTLTGNTLSGLTVDIFGTTDASASAGNTVQICAYFPQDPVTAALTVLTSTGSGNGDYDLAPSSWGIGLPFGYIDENDALQTRDAVIPAVGDDWWNLYATTSQSNALGWLQSVLSPAGIWIGERQGLVTVRAVADVGDLIYDFEHIQDREIIAIRSYSAWAPEQPVEYGGITVQSISASSSDTDLFYDTRPALEAKTVELPYVATNESNWCAAVRVRLLDWYGKVGESFEIELVGFRLAHLAPGDLILITAKFLKTRYDLEGVSLVTSVQPNWFGASTLIKAIHLRDVNQFG